VDGNGFSYSNCLLRDPLIQYTSSNNMVTIDDSMILVIIRFTIDGHMMLWLKMLAGSSLLPQLGVPEDVVQRAAAILEVVRSNSPIERLQCHNITSMDQQHKDYVNNMLAFDARKANLNLFFGDIFPS
ncbi:hypothetical protein Taro_045278, partial [Colocasia esculenta]|nr:hypothetical protein [Colocasia esculenta]